MTKRAFGPAGTRQDSYSLGFAGFASSPARKTKDVRHKAGFILVGLCRVRQFPGTNDKAGPSAVGLPALPVFVGVACGKKALEENRVGIANIFRFDDVIEQPSR